MSLGIDVAFAVLDLLTVATGWLVLMYCVFHPPSVELAIFAAMLVVDGNRIRAMR